VTGSNACAVSDQLRAVVRAAAAAATSRDTRPMRSLLRGPLFSNREARKVTAGLAKLVLSEDPDRNAALLARVLSEGR
jgi:hypothetical protein